MNMHNPTALQLGSRQVPSAALLASPESLGAQWLVQRIYDAHEVFLERSEG